MGLHEKHFPNESPEYRAARDELLRAEADLREQIERVAQKRRGLPAGGRLKENYVFQGLAATGQTESVRLSDLFSRGQNSLIIYGFMFGPQMKRPCPLCTSLIDGFDAIAPHVRERVNMVVVAKSPIGRIMEFARRRGWNRTRFLSSEKNTYNADYWGEDKEGTQYPMVNVFVKKTDGVTHFWGSELLYAPGEGQPRHVDLLWPLWNLFDLTPEGRGTDWYPELSYG